MAPPVDDIIARVRALGGPLAPRLADELELALAGEAGHSSTAARRRRRDDALRAIATQLGGISVAARAAAVRRACRHYAIRWQRSDRHRAEMSEQYRGTIDEQFWIAFQAGPVPTSSSQLRQILAGSIGYAAGVCPGDRQHLYRKSPDDDHFIGAAVAMATNSRPSDIIELLATTPTAKRAIAERDATNTLCREGLIAELRQLERQAEERIPKLNADIAAAVSAVRKAEAALNAARAKYTAATATKATFGYTYSSGRDALEAELRQTASPDIEEFVREMLDEFDKTQKTSIVYEEQYLNNEVTGRKIRIIRTTAASIARRMQAILAARMAAQDLAICEPDQSIIPARLQELRDGLPEIEARPTKNLE